MPQVHPIYDTEARVWATDNDVTARTLAELQRKLPGVKIVGYYPDGYGRTIPFKITPPAEPGIPSFLLRKLPIKEQGAQPRYRAQAPTLFEELDLPELDGPLQELPPVPFTAKMPVVSVLPGLAPRFSQDQTDETATLSNHSPHNDGLAYSHSPQPLPLLPIETPQQADAPQHGQVRRPSQGETGHPPRVAKLTQRERAKAGSHREFVLPPRPWTPDDKHQLRSLVIRGWGDGQIAKHVKRSRNAIIGQRHRLGL